MPQNTTITGKFPVDSSRRLLFLLSLLDIRLVEEIAEENGERDVYGKAEEEILVRLLHYLNKFPFWHNIFAFDSLSG